MAAPLAYPVYILGGVIVRATSQAIAKRLVAAGFRKASQGVASSAANITPATNSNIIALITRGIKGARTSTSGKITKTPPSAKPKSAKEVREALKRNAEKVSSKKFGEKKLSDYGTVGSAPKSVPKAKPASVPVSFSSAAKIPKSETPPEKRAREEAARLPSVKEKPVAKPGEAKQDNLIKNIAEKALKEVDQEDAKRRKQEEAQLRREEKALLKMEAKYLPSSVNKLKSSLRPRARPATVKKALSDFEQAFKTARKKKQYSFSFKDKEYTTRYKEETVAEHKKKFSKKKK
jgi:predicted nuclease with RNAse H fold